MATEYVDAAGAKKIMELAKQDDVSLKLKYCCRFPLWLIVLICLVRI